MRSEMTEMKDQIQAGQADRRCGFCGKSRVDVRTMIVSAENTICDECVVASLDIISRRPAHLNIRIAFLAFRALASFGRLLSRRAGK
jgi:hypothetical protein